ncbi:MULTISPECIES: beta-ketoacyl synthase N-terminal-like domain-containing protein [unclassified Streptomyces]|uniref:beta-ketoacyl synthase N-terminal-like domain-containing protein n=1 Tax=unclassified Streptomyces TaxID=2593676 RepID=UPI0013BEA3D4|nr:beta-ketoacyl synthase N-terminal-like domain-containing protein [Streptomyces sp. CB09001]
MLTPHRPAEADIVVTGVATVVPGPGRPPGAWFDADAELGPRGHKYLPQGTRYLLAAGRRALRSATAPVQVPPDRRGLVVGTNNGLAPLFRAMDRTVVDTGAERLRPALAPYFAVNVLAGRFAAEQALKGFSCTLTTSSVAGVEAVQTAVRALRLDRADLVVVAAVEDLAPSSAGTAGPPPEEGAVALVLEPRAAAERRGAPVRGSLRAAAAFVPPGIDAADPELGLAVGDLLSAVQSEPPAPVHAVLDGSARGTAVGALLGASARRAARPAGAGCLAPLLAAAEPFAAGGGRRVVLTATAAGHLAAVHVLAAAPRPTPSGGLRAQSTA